MKISCITTSVIPSNTANSIQAMKVVHALHQLGNEVNLIVPDYGKADWKEIAEIYGLQSEFEIIWLPFFKPLKKYDFCWNAVNSSLSWGARVVYTWALQAADFALLRNLPSVMELHDFPMGPFGPQLFKWFMNIKTPKIILTTTRALANGIEERFGLHFSEEMLQIAPNGTDIERYEDLPGPKEARRKLKLQKGLTIGYTGHFYQGRGMALLIKLAKSLPEINFLWIGGREEDIQPWKNRLDNENIRNVLITGFIPNSILPLYQAACDILLMPYEKKISGSSGGEISRVINPMKMFDYLAVGRTIVASNIPVFHEVLDEEAAVFCEPENLEDWIVKIKDLINHPADINKLGSNAKKIAAQYTWKKRAGETINRLEKILE